MGFFDLFGKNKNKAALEEAAALEQKKKLQKEEASENLRKAHEGLSWPVPLPLNLMRTGDSANVSHTDDPITQERKEEIGALLYEDKITPEDVNGFSLQELLFLQAAHTVYHKASPLPDYEANHRVIYNDFLRRIHEAKRLWVLYDKATGYPMIDSGYVLVYLDKDHADTAAALYAKQFRKAAVLERAGEAYEPGENGQKQIPFFDYLYYMGMENILVDNGWYKGELKRSEISAPPTFAMDPKQIPPASPALAYAMCDFIGEMRWPVKYEKREENLKKKMNRVNVLIPSSRFVVPVMVSGASQAGQAKDSENIQEKDPAASGFAGTDPVPDGTEVADAAALPKQEIKLPLVEMKSPDGKTVKKFLPVFTDLFEYSRHFAKSEFKPAVFPYSNLLTFLGGNDGFVINPKGQSIVIPKERANMDGIS